MAADLDQRLIKHHAASPVFAFPLCEAQSLRSRLRSRPRRLVFFSTVYAEACGRLIEDLDIT